MTFLELQQELTTVSGARFKPAQIASVKRWINHRYSILWSMEDWTFKKAYTSLSVTANSATATPPASFARPLAIWRDDGTRLRYVRPEEYGSANVGNTTASSPDKYTVVNKSILLDPIPGTTSSAWQIHYELSPWVGSNPTSGPPLVNDNDVPLIPVEFHYLLVPAATDIGSVQMNDFTYQFAAQAWMNDLDAMRRLYLNDVSGETTQWARDTAWC